MNTENAPAGSVEVEVPEAVREQLTDLLQQTRLPIVIRIGNRKCMVIMLPPDKLDDITNNNDVKARNRHHKPRHGELRDELKKITSGLKLSEGKTVPSSRVYWITNELKRRGLDVTYETVRTKLRVIGYYSEKK